MSDELFTPVPGVLIFVLSMSECYGVVWYSWYILFMYYIQYVCVCVYNNNIRFIVCEKPKS